jgi:amino acid adenylation domain-containing protein
LVGALERPLLAEAFERVAAPRSITFELHAWQGLDEPARDEQRRRSSGRARAACTGRSEVPSEYVVLCQCDGETTELVWTFREPRAVRRSIAGALDEVFETYRALEAGTVAGHRRAPEPRAAAAAREELAALRAYLGQLLDGVETATAAPGIEPSGRRGTLRGHGRLERPLSPELRAVLAAVVVRHGLSEDSVFRAAWALLVARFTGAEDAIFGVRAGRPGVAAGTTSGVVLPFRVRVAGELRVRDFFATVHALELAARPFQALPPVELERELATTAASLELESVLSFEPHPTLPLLARARLPRVVSASLDEESPAPLTLHVFELPEGGFSLALDCERARFRAGMAERLLDTFLFVLEQLFANDERPLRELSAVRPAERRLLLETWNDTAREFPAELLIHEPFEAQARTRAHAVAVETATAAVSFGELDALANRLAHALRARGAAPGVRVGLCLERGVSLVAAMLAVSKSGAAYVPLDATYPDERLQTLIDDALPAVIVTEAAFAGRFTGELLSLDGTDLSAYPCTPPARLAASDDDCYVIYTSGSTGTPKGVVLQHRAVINTCAWVTRELGVGPGDRLLFVTSPCFDLSVYDVFGALGAGATVVVAEQALLREPAALGRALLEREITIWNSAPAALERLMPFVPREPPAGRLRLVLLSGDFIPLALVARLAQSFPSARLLSLGGATEAAIWSNSYPIGALEPEWTSVPYGRPLQNCRYYALDARLEPVPIGAVGELYIGGACLARGYLNRPELTAAHFVADPFTPSPGARLYRTGDLVRYFEDGQLEILGRADSQVKIRGYRVELREVEAALSAIAGVERAVCAAMKLDSSGQRSLVAYVVLRAGATLTATALKRELSLVLPEFMLPARVVFLETLPLSSNGKLDRGALPPPVELAPLDDAELPLTETERAVAAIWRRVLNRGAVGREDDFFALGGHSLLAVSLIEEVRRVLAVELPVTALLDGPTLSAFAARIEQTRGAGSSAHAGGGVGAVVSFQRGGVAPELFCIGGLGGNPLGIRRLAVELGAEQPVHGLYNPSFDARSVRSIEELARELYVEIRRLRPRGPYYLSGFSAGGVIAFELAHLLQAAGEAVPLLVMLDAYNPKLPRWSRQERVALFLSMCREAGAAYAWRRLRARIRFELKYAGLRYLGRSLGAPNDFFGMQAAFVRALARYEPKSYDGDVLLVRAAPGTASDVDYRTHESNGWRDLVRGKLEIVNLGCRHEDVLREHVPAVARIMRAALRARR